jgi:uncharacterized protein YndB with AHSA1/START domain
MIEIVKEIERVHRELRDGGDGTKAVVLRRHYDAAVEDVWDACTDAERLRRWFLPVSGDLRVGGHYQLEGNAGGEILHCEPPRRLKVTWVLGDAPGRSEVEVLLSAGDDKRTLFELRHTAEPPPGMWERFGPGAVGVGWDVALLAFAEYLAGSMLGDPGTWETSDEGRRFATESSVAWGAAYRAAGATDAEAAAATANTTAFYAP